MIEKNEIPETDLAKATANNKMMRRRDIYAASTLLLQVIGTVFLLYNGDAPATALGRAFATIMLLDALPFAFGVMWLLYRYPRQRSFFLKPWTAAIMGFFYFYLKLIKQSGV